MKLEYLAELEHLQVQGEGTAEKRPRSNSGTLSRDMKGTRGGRGAGEACFTRGRSTGGAVTR